MTSWEKLQREIVSCERCPRLRAYCGQIALQKKAAFRDWDYWGKPIPNMGESTARLLIVGLAPAAHGANRTGRMFTGDRSGDFLFKAMHETGFASQPMSVSREDGLRLIDCAITAVAHCAPPGNKPLPVEVGNCSSHFERTVDLMPNLAGMLALGRIAFEGCVRLYRSRGWIPKGHGLAFGHGLFHAIPGAPFILCCYHPSQQNTFTGKLTPAMIRDVFREARRQISR
jgi:uracil-DNA glycosylase family 4